MSVLLFLLFKLEWSRRESACNAKVMHCHCCFYWPVFPAFPYCMLCRACHVKGCECMYMCNIHRSPSLRSPVLAVIRIKTPVPMLDWWGCDKMLHHQSLHWLPFSPCRKEGGTVPFKKGNPSYISWLVFCCMSSLRHLGSRDGCVTKHSGDKTSQMW